MLPTQGYGMGQAIVTYGYGAFAGAEEPTVHMPEYYSILVKFDIDSVGVT